MDVFFIPELPEDVIKMAKDIKPITEIKQNGKDFVVTSKTPGKTLTNSFTIGKEADITTMDGKKLKVCWSLWSEPALGTFHVLIHVSCVSSPQTHSALSRWRGANWSAKLESSVTYRSSKVEKWLRYSGLHIFKKIDITMYIYIDISIYMYIYLDI